MGFLIKLPLTIKRVTYKRTIKAVISKNLSLLFTMLGFSSLKRLILFLEVKKKIFLAMYLATWLFCKMNYVQ